MAGDDHPTALFARDMAATYGTVPSVLATHFVGSGEPWSMRSRAVCLLVYCRKGASLVLGQERADLAQASGILRLLNRLGLPSAQVVHLAQLSRAHHVWQFTVNVKLPETLRVGRCRLAPGIGFELRAVHYPERLNVAPGIIHNIPLGFDMARIASAARETISGLECLEHAELALWPGTNVQTGRANVTVVYEDHHGKDKDLPLDMWTNLGGFRKRHFAHDVFVGSRQFLLTSPPPCFACGDICHEYSACPVLASLDGAPLLDIDAPAPAPTPHTHLPPSDPAQPAAPTAKPRKKGKKAKAAVIIPPVVAAPTGTALKRKRRGGDDENEDPVSLV